MGSYTKLPVTFNLAFTDYMKMDKKDKTSV